MKKCQNCNLTFDDAKKFCNKCGKPLEGSKASDIEINSKKEVFEDKLKAEPQNTGLLIEYAKFLIEYELLNNALPILYKVQAIEPNNMVSKRMLMECYNKLNNTEKVLQIGKEILLKQPQDEAVLMLMANIQFKNGCYSDCLTSIDQVIQLDSDNFEALKIKAQILFKTGKEKESLGVWQKVYKLNKTDLLANIFTGVFACEANDYEIAIKLLQPVVEKEAGTADEKLLAAVYFLFAQTKLNMPGNEIESSIKKYLSQVIPANISREKTKKALADIYMYVGENLASQGKYREAIEFYRKARGMEENERSGNAISEALFNIGKKEFSLKNYDEAKKSFQDALKQCPDKPECKSYIDKIAKRERKKKNLLIFIICSVVLLAGVAGVIWYFAHGDLTVTVEPRCNIVLKKGTEKILDITGDLMKGKIFPGVYTLEFKAFENFADSVVHVDVRVASKTNIIVKLRPSSGQIIVPVLKNWKGKWGYINTNGAIIVSPKFDQARNMKEGLAAIIFNGKGGYIDKAGKIVINPQFEFPGDFSDGFATVKINNKWGFIDKTGKIVIDPQFEYSFNFHQGLALYQIGGYIGEGGGPRGGKRGYIDKSGKIVINAQFEYAGDFQDNLACIEINGKYGFIDKSGKIIINAQFENAMDFQDGLASVQINKKWGFIDESGKIVINPQFEYSNNFHGGLLSVEIDKKYGFIDKSGKIIINAQFENAMDFQDGLAKVKIDKKWGFIDRSGKIVIYPQFEWIDNFKDGVAVIHKDNKCGLIDNMGNIVVNAEFDIIGEFRD
jgi:tetratricopeptide (TPR) repeat protein